MCRWKALVWNLPFDHHVVTVKICHYRNSRFLEALDILRCR